MLAKPFIKLNGEYILVLPTAELFSINEFLIEEAKNANYLESLIDLYNEHEYDEVFPLFIKMGWKPLKFDFSKNTLQAINLHFQQSLFSFDTNKVGLFVLISETAKTHQRTIEDVETFSKIISSYISSLSQKIKRIYPTNEILLIGITSRYRILNRFSFALSAIDNVAEIILSGKVEFEAILANWKFNTLSLWKYAKSLSEAQKLIRFVPGNTHLSKFYWYMKNDESFFESDKEVKGTDYFFGFEIEGEVLRKGLSKLDKIGIPYFAEGTFGYLQCIRKEEHFPVYISLEFQYGIVKSCLWKYKSPIWVQSKKRGDSLGEVYVNAILYWLNEIYEDAKDFINQLGKLPIIFEIELDEKLYKLQTINVEEKESFFRYQTDFNNGTISFSIPVEIVNHISDSGNYGERIIIQFVLNAIGEFLERIQKGKRLSDKQVASIIQRHFNYSNKKMILHSDGGADIKLTEVDLSNSRYIPDADVSFLLQNQVSWLKGAKTVSDEISTEKGKIEMLNGLVSLHLKKVQGIISNFPYLELLENLIRRNEGLIRKRTFRKLSYPARLGCYHKYYDVYKEFSKSETDLVEATLALRVLIEFVYCERPKGAMIVSDDDVDLMLAHVLEIVNYGFISDSIKFEIENPGMRILKSRRLGIEKNSSVYLNKFREDVHGEELYSYTERFKAFFTDFSSKNQSEDEKGFLKKTEEGFKTDWGISLWTLNDIFHFLAIYCFKNGKSVLMVEETELQNELTNNLNLDEVQIKFFLEKFTLVSRNGIMNVPEGYNQWDIYPWRYSRQLSYMTRPILRFDIDNKVHFLLSPRQMLVSAENLISKFYDGTLKTNKQDKNIQSLLVEINVRKGREFRNEVLEWLRENTHLEPIPYEVKISNRGFFKSSVDKGDVDILAIDKSNKVLFSIECKNTAQSKVAYEFKQDIDNYLGVKENEGLIHKHVKRDIWLHENRAYVLNRVGLDTDYRIKSIVITNNILPLKYLEKAPLPIYSFYEVKSGKFKFDK